MASRKQQIADRKSKVIFIVGPTAVGKTEVAINLAKKINAEIISCDSMQVYKGMDILTSKPSPALRKKVAHYLINRVPLGAEYNVARYRQEAAQKIKEIISKGKIPLIVGGTGLYMSILIDGIFKIPSQNKKFRSLLYRQAENLGSAYLYRRLKGLDPEAAARIHPHDRKRIIRALEVFEATGQPISKLQKQRKGLTDKYNIKIFCLNIERQKLYKRIGERIERMFRRGLVGEVKSLLKLRLSQTASCAIGIKELKGYLDGLYGLEEAKRLMFRNTRHYVKRQLSWFRKDKRIKWINVNAQQGPKEIADKIICQLKERC
ncbi:MAG: tRNA (adenosine(37)-N6)-dimethylallyltransferase MiaA [Candidatus Omnitrophica bacterium]|nr:tRNA (adenosine(37)-N6)-dimethylallyltransferase MiaA [Candidatus Omnitrophota bacterium]MBU4472959.1 tRNA (adenosine(37)-N6)-dimethylallyltransferase MiaA [Candidatus Omnitrophota bacterium]MCG2706967.1 tRNA (adenosine(37)-N6)-dimethylallyltransferase MiaA [Candidatus Omnitrophota bacterium]